MERALYGCVCLRYFASAVAFGAWWRSPFIFYRSGGVGGKEGRGGKRGKRGEGRGERKEKERERERKGDQEGVPHHVPVGSVG